MHRDEDLSHELCVSAMLFSSLDNLNSSIHCENIDDEDPYELTHNSNKSLQECIAEEGLEYVGGYIASKFPQYTFLRADDRGNIDNWINAKSYKEGSLVTPSKEFFTELEKMERLFNCYHGETGLKEGRDIIKNILKEMVKYVNVPADVIFFL